MKSYSGSPVSEPVYKVLRRAYYMESGTFRAEYNPYPGILFFDPVNPSLRSESCEYDLLFEMTKDSMVDTEIFRSFVKSAIYGFRRSAYYKAYKSYLINYLGLNKAQTMGNITADMADLEMHHNFLTIDDIAVMITLHMINTVGRCTTFDIMQILMIEHFANRIPIVILDKTSHDKYHDDIENYIPPNMTFGKWWELLYLYRYGITISIARKVMMFINRFYQKTDPMQLKLRGEVLSFVELNPYKEEESL